MGLSSPVAQPYLARLNAPIAPASVAEGDDPTWYWACAAGAELLKAGLRRGAAGIGFAHKPDVQELVLALQRHAPRAPEFEDFADRIERDPYFAAEATLRGSAVELCILLIFWLSKEAGSTYAATPREGLALTPAVRAALESGLEDRSLNGRIPRAILGKYLRWLFHFGESWLTENMTLLFPPSDDQLRRAAFLGHLLHDGGPLGDKLDDMRGAYAHEIGLIADTSNDREEYRLKRLGDYLVALYLHERLDLQPGGSLDAFLTKASEKVRQHVMWSLGTNLNRPTTDFPELQRTRALAYWDSRLAAGEATTDRAKFRGRARFHRAVVRQPSNRARVAFRPPAEDVARRARPSACIQCCAVVGHGSRNTCGSRCRGLGRAAHESKR